MKEQFKEYLIMQGYSVTTPRGKPSTVYDYLKRIDKVCEWENTTWMSLTDNIYAFLSQYDVGGSKEALGKTSHSAVINALRRYSEFLTTKTK